VAVTADDTTGSITVQATHPTPVGDQPTVISQDIYRSEAGAEAIRIAAGLSPTEPYLDYAVRSVVVYGYLVRAIGTTGAGADSALTY
jgi:hypothetical protein